MLPLDFYLFDYLDLTLRLLEPKTCLVLGLIYFSAI